MCFRRLPSQTLSCGPTKMRDAIPSRQSHFVGVEEFAERSLLSVSTVRRRINDGSLPYVQPGGFRTRILIPADALTALLHGSQQGSTASEPRREYSSNSSEVTPERLPGPEPRWARIGIGRRS
jgi:excisionase family DNA binding protein